MASLFEKDHRFLEIPAMHFLRIGSVALFFEKYHPYLEILATCINMFKKDDVEMSYLLLWTSGWARYANHLQGRTHLQRFERPYI